MLTELNSVHVKLNSVHVKLNSVHVNTLRVLGLYQIHYTRLLTLLTFEIFCTTTGIEAGCETCQKRPTNVKKTPTAYGDW